jgi:hypothetical protein
MSIRSLRESSRVLPLATRLDSCLRGVLDPLAARVWSNDPRRPERLQLVSRSLHIPCLSALLFDGNKSEVVVRCRLPVLFASS